MEERPTRRQPYARKVWPPEPARPAEGAPTLGKPEPAGEKPVRRAPRPERFAEEPVRRGAEALPPSARWYGTPAPPPRHAPRWLRPVLVMALALVACTALIGIVATVVTRLTTPEPVRVVLRDELAGVSFPLPAGWREGAPAPVTAFTSIATNGTALVMARPGPALGERKLDEHARDHAELYSRLLLHGDTVDVVDDRPLTVAGQPGHSRALRAEYTDVVNRPAYLRVVVTGRGERTIVLVAVAQPDDARARADIDAIVAGLTRRG